MKKLLALVLSLAMCVSFVACGEESTAANDNGEKTLKVAAIVSNLGDKSFNDSANTGLSKAAEDFGLEYKCIEFGTDDSKAVPTLTETVEEGYDVIAFTNLAFGAATDWLDEYAESYPDTTFLIYDEYVWENTHDNVKLLKYRQSESDFLSGVIAGTMTESNVVGFVGGMDTPVIADFLVGFIDGVKYANPDAVVKTAYTESWSDAAKGKELALAQINEGADFIHAVAGASGNGALEAAQEKGVWGIGVDADQYELFKEAQPDLAKSIITSSLKDVGASLYTCVEEILNGTFEGNGDRWFGMEDGAIGIAENENYKANVPQEVQDAVEEAKTKIASGEIKVSSYFDMTAEEYAAKVDNAAK